VQRPYQPTRNGILCKQHGNLVTPFHFLIFKVFFTHGEILEYAYQFYFSVSVPLWCARCLKIKAGSSASQKTIGSYSSWFMLLTRQRFFNLVYIKENKSSHTCVLWNKDLLDRRLWQFYTQLKRLRKESLEKNEAWTGLELMRGPFSCALSWHLNPSMHDVLVWNRHGIIWKDLFIEDMEHVISVSLCFDSEWRIQQYIIQIGCPHW